MASSTRIVENGIFRRGITDLYSATALKIPRSANGRRQDYSRKAYARMSNTYFAPVGISGYVPEVLQSISAVSREVQLDGGSCGKGHKEIVPVASGGPHLLLKARLG